MNDNPLIKEIRKHRDAILASHHGNYVSMMEAMRKKQWESGHEIVSSPSKTKDKKSKASSLRKKAEPPANVM